MSGVSIVLYKSITLVYTDMSEAKPLEVMDICAQSREILSQFAPHSAYVLANVKNIRFNSQVIQVIKETARYNSPFVKTSVVYGLEGFTQLLVNVVSNFSSRELKVVGSL